jgi:hypothetical protein
MAVLRWVGITVMAVFFFVNLTQPLWVDDTPIYSPWIGVFVWAPCCAVGAITLWRVR